MNFKKTKRTPQQIQQEYSQVCATIGQLTVTQEVLPLQIEELLRKAKELDKEYKAAADELTKQKPTTPQQGMSAPV